MNGLSDLNREQSMKIKDQTENVEEYKSILHFRYFNNKLVIHQLKLVAPEL